MSAQMWKRYLPQEILRLIHGKLGNSLYYPPSNLTFRAFELCNPDDVKVVFIGQDPYNGPNVATGILFGNNPDTQESNLSPSLKIIKESVINYEVPHQNIIFDNSLESWCRQGILMLNSSLTVEPHNPGSHFLLWLPFMKEFLKRFGTSNPGIIYVLFGKQAQLLEHSIVNGVILKEYHPAWYARNNSIMPQSIFNEVNKLLKGKYNETIKWFQESN